ncbi:C40 family peptidase [Paenibacillus sp. SN-8-1]|uniref:C40 family peptidase n=1 Tax=Paenibacillus sp. SN-8-1 TaxID=3435409 RepID=UPI003D9A2E84
MKRKETKSRGDSRTNIKKIQVKRNLKQNLKLTRHTPVNAPSIRASLRSHIKGRAKEKIKALPRKAVKQTIRTLDPHHHEDADITFQSLELPRDSIRKLRNTYHNVKKTASRMQRAHNYLRNRRTKTRVLSAHRKTRENVVSSTKAANNVKKIKTLSSKYVSKGKYTSLGIKTGLKKVVSSPVEYLGIAAQQIGKKLMTAVVTNPKVWLVGVIIGALIFFMMMLTNSAGGLITSASGAFFMTDEDNAKQYKEIVEQLNNEFQAEIQALQKSSYDDIRTEYMNEDGMIHANWVELFAILTVHFEQNIDFSEKQQKYLEELYPKFNEIKTATETYTVSECTYIQGKQYCYDVTKRRLIIKVYSYDMEDVFSKVGFNEEQQEWARRLVTSGSIQKQFPELAESLPGGGTDSGSGSGSTLPPSEYEDLLKNLHGDIGAARKKLIETALTLVGKVGYFWGGKSGPGWNDQWGTLMKITAPGSEKTGTLQPYGLDCSGFIDWSFKTTGLGNSFSSGGTTYQWSKTYSISKDEMIPGDLIFKNIPGQGGVNHIGIYIGKDQKGNNLYVHCQGGTGVIVSSYKGFKYPRRPILFKKG